MVHIRNRKISLDVVSGLAMPHTMVVTKKLKHKVGVDQCRQVMSTPCFPTQCHAVRTQNQIRNLQLK